MVSGSESERDAERMAKFAANFWGSDFCSTAGFDTLVKRLKEGKRTCQDFEDYLERRYRIEKDYGESLLQLARRCPGRDEIGSLRKCWDQLKLETEAIGKIHQNLAHKINEEIHHSVKEFREQQRDVRKKSEDTVKRSAAHKKSCFERNNRLKTTYEGKCRDADRAEENHTRLQSNPTTKPKDLQQAQKRMEGSRSATNNADMAYQEMVKNLEEARQLWEREMELLCKQFQGLEEQRIAFLRHQMWTYCNLCSQATVSEDEAFENVRKALESCDVDADIDLFVREKTTGTERPTAIPYENYYHPTSAEMLTGPGGKVPPPSQRELPPTPDEAMTDDAPSNELIYTSIPDSGVTVDTSALVDEGYYAAPKPSSEKMIAVYDYDAQGDQELSLVEGDIVTLIAKEDEMWWCGQVRGQVGMFPSTYVEPYEDQGSIV